MVWEYVETYCGCKIYKQRYGDHYIWKSPCDESFRKSKANLKKRIRNSGYCGGTPTEPPPGETKPPVGLNRSYLGFNGTIGQRLEGRNLLSIISCELQLYGKAIQPPAKAVVRLAGDSDDWGESTVNWYNQPNVGGKVGELSEVPASETYFPIPLDLDKIIDVEDMTLQLSGREQGSNSYFYASERTDIPPKIVITGIKVI